jgi:hypothetical protein
MNDYKEAYLQNPSKTINDLTKYIESLMQDTVTYVKDPASLAFHENIMQITRKGMNHENHDPAIPLRERWEYSRRLALWLNENDPEQNAELAALKKDLDSYFRLQKKMRIEDRFVLAQTRPELTDRKKELTELLLMWPLALLGFIHGFIPYFLVKKFTEKAFRRKVFWGSVKMMLGKLVGALYNIPIILLLNRYVFPGNWIGLAYFFVIPSLCYIAYWYVHALREFRIKGVMKKMDFSGLAAKRADLEKRICELIPVA